MIIMMTIEIDRHGLIRIKRQYGNSGYANGAGTRKDLRVMEMIGIVPSVTKSEQVYQ
jgi:hypothetical protein